MTVVFLKLLNMSIAASWLVLAVIVLRLFLKKSPSWIVCLLWGIVALRLIMPFTFESALSLIPSAEVIPLDVAVSETPAIYSGIPVVNSAVNPVVTQQVATHTVDLAQLVRYAAIVWAAGVVLILVYSAVTYLKLHRQVAISIPCQEDVYLCDNVESPFLLGIFRPKIYLPSDLPEEQMCFVLAHENAHMKRWDHLWKPIGFMLLTIYWFNPLLWVGYILLCRDIERACDEKVIAEMDPAGKVGYSTALVACSVHRRMVMACPVAFGEVSVKSRIKAVLSYKKPVFWVVCVSVLVCVVTAACFLTNPQMCIHAYTDTITTEPTCIETGLQTRECSHCQHSYTVLLDKLAHTYDSGVVMQEATCTHTGSMEFTCVYCGDHKQQGLEMIAHTASNNVYVKEADCTHEGAVMDSCSQCNVIFTSQVLPVNHDHDLYDTVIKEPTCKETGEGIRKCSRCDYSESCIYEKIPHNYVITKTHEPTCQTIGWEVGACEFCGDDYYSETSGKVDHQWNYYGSNKKKCVVCGMTVPAGDYTLFDTRTQPGSVTFPGSGNTVAGSGSLFPSISIWP